MIQQFWWEECTRHPGGEWHGNSRADCFSQLYDPLSYSQVGHAKRSLCEFWLNQEVQVIGSLTAIPLTRPSSTLSPADTKMSRSLPLEILDLITDNLHDEPKTLKSCCTTFKGWIYPARKHLFNHVYFRHAGRHVNEWRKTFPDPANSPAHHTRTLTILHPEIITAADTDTLLTFCCVSRLNMDAACYDRPVCLVPLHGFSPAVRSLDLTFEGSQISDVFDLVCSFPLLEDLSLLYPLNPGTRDKAPNTFSTSPRLTGSLVLRTNGAIQSTASQLLDLPNGLHFKKISVSWVAPGDIGSTASLVSTCSDTLESLEISDHLAGACSLISLCQVNNLSLRADKSGTTPLDLSGATALRDVRFDFQGPSIRWITAVLRTTRVRDLRTISLALQLYPTTWLVHEWIDLDLLLAQSRISHPLRLEVKYQWGGWEFLEDGVARLLPESTKRGIVDIVHCKPLN